MSDKEEARAWFALLGGIPAKSLGLHTAYAGCSIRASRVIRIRFSGPATPLADGT